MSSAPIEARFAGRLGGFSLDVAFEAPMRGVTALFGPSGCGKTTVLRCMAGLERLPGRLLVGGEVWQDGRVFLPAHRRAVGYVFQEASLFPHLSVRENLLYGHKRALKLGPERIGLEEVSDLLGLDRLIGRTPNRLSGGERQRVSIGRALLSQPRLLLMDEPLSALDRMAKDEILPYFERLHRELDIPIVFVSHDIAEVERLADRVVALRAGHVEMTGPLNEALLHPALPFRLRREAAAVLEGRVTGFDEQDGLVSLDVSGEEFWVAGPGPEIGEAVRLRIGAGDVSLARAMPTASTILNILPVTIEALEEAGDSEVSLTLRLGRQSLLCRITKRSARSLELQEGDRIFAQVKAASAQFSGNEIVSSERGSSPQRRA